MPEEGEPIGQQGSSEAVLEVFHADLVLEVLVAFAAQRDPPEVAEALLVERPIRHVAKGGGQGGVGADAPVELVDHLGDQRTTDGFGQTHKMYPVCILSRRLAESNMLDISLRDAAE